MAAVFCEHRRVKTICPECKPRAEPVPVQLPSGRVPAALPREPDESAEEVGPRGPGKPLLPTRKRARKATAEDVERAEAWWVKRE